MASLSKQIITIAIIAMLMMDSITCKFLKNNIQSFADENVIDTITEDDESALIEAVKTLNQNGGTIYINTPVINMKSTIKLTGSAAGGIVGMKQSNEQYPRLDFKPSRDSGSTDRGITITGSNYYIKYLIIENAGDNGIWIGGKKNTIDHVITRYNNDSGIQLSNGADSNTLNYCYSYRNCDVNNHGGNADGFAPKLGASNTVFNYCFAWDNSDDGWDSFDKQDLKTMSVSYMHSACWNNGNPDVFIGKYDYTNGKSLDKNMWTIQQMIESDSNFESNYKNKKFNTDNAKINGENVKDWLTKASGAMNGNGYKLGSNYTPQSTDVKRIAEYSVAFDHKNKGFDANSSQKCSGHFVNCVAFNNNINYYLPYTFEKWSNNWSWSAKKADQSGMKKTLNKPSDTNSATKAFYAVRDQIIKNAAANQFNDNINFDNAIKGLSK